MCEQETTKSLQTIHFSDGGKFVDGKNHFGKLLRQKKIIDREFQKQKL